MNIYKIFSKLLVPGFIVLFSVTAAAKDEWLRVSSKNFQLVGNVSEKQIRETAIKLEQFRETFQRFFTVANVNLPITVKVFVLKDEKFLSDLKSEAEINRAADLFQSGEENKSLVILVEDIKPPDYRAIYHNYAHFLLNENLGRADIQPWLNEGLAAYYETFQVEKERKARVGGLNQDYLSMLRQNKLIPFESFFNTDYYSLQKQGNHGAGLFYAQAWALTHFLMQSENGARRRQLNKFIELVSSGKNPKYVFSEAFQTNYAAMESELKKYIERQNFPAVVVDLKDEIAFENEMPSAPLTEAETKILAGDLFYQSGRLPEAAVKFEEALILDPKSSAAYSSLGLIKLKQGKFEEAQKILEKAVALDDRNYLAHYRYAGVLSRAKMTDYGFASNFTAAQAAQIRASLDKAIALNPNFSESYNLYAFVNYVRNEELEKAKEYIETAVKLAPGNQWHQMRVAELSMLDEDFAKARRIARKIYETAPDEKLRVYAKNTIYTIDTYQSQIESLRNPNRRKFLHEVTDQPLTDEENARLNWLAMLEGINQNLRGLKPDEKRVLGYLARIECGAGGIEYLIKTENQILKLNSETFDTLTLMSYSADESGGQVGCETLKKEKFAIISYRPTPQAKSAGEIVSIEFVPENFKFLD